MGKIKQLLGEYIEFDDIDAERQYENELREYRLEELRDRQREDGINALGYAEGHPPTLEQATELRQQSLNNISNTDNGINN